MTYPQEIKVVRFLIHETGTYNEQFRRPYMSQLTPSGLNQIMDAVTSTPKITPAIFSGLSNQVASPSATPEAAIQIPGGWSERRLNFMLQIEVRYKTGGIIHEILTGWSETPAGNVSIYGTLDPNTTFRINNTVLLRTQTVPTPFGNQTQTQISDCSHILEDDNWSGIRAPERKTLLRPIDIFSKMLTSGIENEMSAVGSFNGSDTLTRIATKSRRSNNVSSNYLSDIVKSYTNAAKQIGIGEDSIGGDDVLGSAQGYARENTASRDPFMETIASMRAMPISNMFTLQEIERIDPNASNNTVYVKLSTTDKAVKHQAGQTQHWGGSDLHTYVATVLSNSVPSIMVNHLITKVAFVSTNMDITGALDTRIADLNGFVQNVDMTANSQAFVAKLENEVLRDIIQTYSIGIGVQMSVDLLGETWIKLNINGEEIDFVTPSFCDAVLTPVVTTNRQASMSLAGDMRTLLENITDHAGLSNSGGVGDAKGLLNYSGMF